MTRLCLAWIEFFRPFDCFNFLSLLNHQKVLYELNHKQAISAEKKIFYQKKNNLEVEDESKRENNLI
ncbi:hypothetical protein DERF_012481 [Dermatophagoides farinae]|uniref:Uncharacterized protein n=1 Tax=Dermatophagoides farinae TaxID=6954 RepID=A0A922L3H3_DERFA|nr:hypothetical protein DERF_012481 [Dermatophagoides farinae]